MREVICVKAYGFDLLAAPVPLRPCSNGIGEARLIVAGSGDTAQLTYHRRDGQGHAIDVTMAAAGSPNRPMTSPTFVPLTGYVEYSEAEMIRRARAFCDDISRRRTVREFSNRPVPRAVIESCLLAAGTAPNGANMQPWHFVVVSDPAVKARIRVEAEREEREFYEHKAPQEWLDALAPLGTDARKPFLEAAPYLIAIFAQSYGVLADGRRVKHYYAQESVGIATGFLISAVHHAGLVSLTHTPSPMGFLNEILGRPSNERPFLILVVGYPAKDASVPAISKRSLADIATFV